MKAQERHHLRTNQLAITLEKASAWAKATKNKLLASATVVLVVVAVVPRLDYHNTAAGERPPPTSAGPCSPTTKSMAGGRRVCQRAAIGRIALYYQGLLLLNQRFPRRPATRAAGWTPSSEEVFEKVPSRIARWPPRRPHSSWPRSPRTAASSTGPPSNTTR